MDALTPREIQILHDLLCTAREAAKYDEDAELQKELEALLAKLQAS